MSHWEGRRHSRHASPRPLPRYRHPRAGTPGAGAHTPDTPPRDSRRLGPLAPLRPHRTGGERLWITTNVSPGSSCTSVVGSVVQTLSVQLYSRCRNLVGQHRTLTLDIDTGHSSNATVTNRARVAREVLELLELLETTSTAGSPLEFGSISSAADAGAVTARFSESVTTLSSPRIFLFPRPPHQKTDMSKNRPEPAPKRADRLEWLDFEPLPGSRPMLRRSLRIVAVLELPCRWPRCSRPVLYPSQRLCRRHYQHTRKRLGPPRERAADGRGPARLEHVGYQGTHSRNVARFGPAESYRCELCPHQAAEWALPPSLAAESVPRDRAPLLTRARGLHAAMRELPSPAGQEQSCCARRGPPAPRSAAPRDPARALGR